MKGKIKNTLVSLLVAMLLMMPVLAYDVPADKHPANSLWIEPSTKTLDGKAVKDTFTVTVYINCSMPYPVGIGGWQFKMYYPNSFLDAIDCKWSGTGNTRSQLFEKAGANNVPFVPIYGPNYVLFGESWGSGNFANATHCPSSVCYVTFNITKVPTKGETFTGALNISKGIGEVETWTIGSDLIKYIDAAYDCELTFNWLEPEKPWFTLDPKDTVFDKFTNVTVPPKYFNISVVIANYYDGWGMTNATFCLHNTNTSLLDVTNVFVNTDEWTLHSLAEADGWVNVTVKDFSGSGYSGESVLVAKIEFLCLYQDTAPPRTAGDYDESKLEFCDETKVFDHSYQIDVAPVDGSVKVYAFQAIPLPHLAVEFSPDNEIILGPAPCVGAEFKANIVIKELHFAWYLVGLDFKLEYCPDLLEVLDMEEGPYFPEHIQTGAPPPGTIFMAFDEYPPHPYLTAMDLILPEYVSGTYPDPLPGAEPPEDGVVAIITFKVLKQDVGCDPETYECELGLYDIMMVDRNGGYISYEDPENGTVRVLGSYEVGRIIDVYTQYPEPYGGQGPNAPSDMFWPQKEVILCANVSYNCWPMQMKLVTFTVWDNEDNVWTQLVDFTDENGVACVSFRMPWPCEDPESLFGVWKVRADVDVACVIIEDWVEWHYDYMINIVKVTTDKYYYKHWEWVNVTVEFTSHAQQTYDAAIWVTIFDNLNVPIATREVVFEIGGAEFCTAKEYTRELRLFIEKFAAAGEATVYVTTRFYDEVNDAWVAAGPIGFTKIYILPV